MKYKLIKPTNPDYSALEQILVNRNIEYENIYHYLHTTDNDINSFELLGWRNLENAVRELIYAVKNNLKACVIVDVDVDGYTSAAHLINYLHDLFPQWVENKLEWKHHKGKQHGLQDLIDELIKENYKLILCPDSSTDDIEEHKILREHGCEIIVLDHHPQKKVSEDAMIINNQCSDYPNKNLSGVGVVWQFCRYLDSILRTSYSDNYLDLVALGLSSWANISFPFISGVFKNN